MARVTVKVTGKPVDKIAKSGELLVQLEPIADRVEAAMRSDSNEAFVASVRKRPFRTGGRKGRVSWQIGAHPVIGARVEAKRQTISRAAREA